MNRRRDMIKLLVWDRTGFVIYCKRLEQGTFEKPIREDNSGGIQLSWEELMLILEGIALDSVKPSPKTGTKKSINLCLDEEVKI